MNTQPQSYKYLKKVAASIFSPIKRCDCSTCFFVAGGGRRTLIKFLLKEKEIIKSVLGTNFPKTVFIYVEPDELLEVSNQAYLALIAKQLKKVVDYLKIPQTTAVPPLLLDLIKQYVSILTHKGLIVVFILNDFEITLSLSSSIFLNFEAIMNVNKSQVTYLFLSSVNIFAPDILPKLHNLKYALSQNIFYVSLLGKAEVNFMLQQIAEKLGNKFSTEVRETIYTICGGHAQLVKYAAYALASAETPFSQDVEKTKKLLLAHSQLDMVCSDIWNVLHVEERSIITHVVKTGALPQTTFPVDFLLKIGLVHYEAQSGYTLFGTLFRDYVYNKIPKDTLYYDDTKNQIYFGTKSCSHIFTLQEFKIISHLLKQKGA
ncbi:MAG: hypothetical protein UV17_C0063G0001, partial [Candidatus Gottesmanbacteria bacterium GW2011_GWA1_42_26]